MGRRRGRRPGRGGWLGGRVKTAKARAVVLEWGRAGSEGGILVLIEDVTNHVVESPAIHPSPEATSSLVHRGSNAAVTVPDPSTSPHPSVAPAGLGVPTSRRTTGLRQDHTREGPAAPADGR